MKNRNWLGMTMHQRSVNSQRWHKRHRRRSRFSFTKLFVNSKRHRLIFRAHMKFNIPIALYV